jgi:hypothetical protein
VTAFCGRERGDGQAVRRRRRRRQLGEERPARRRPLGERAFRIARERERQRHRRCRPPAQHLVPDLDRPLVGEPRERRLRPRQQLEEARQRQLTVGVGQRAEHRIARRVRDERPLSLERAPPELRQSHRALGRRLLALRQRRAQHLAERRLVVVGGPATEGDHRLVERRLPAHHLLDLLGLDATRRRSPPDDETGDRAGAERNDHLRPHHRGSARTRIAVGEGPRHRQRHRHLEQRARDFGVRHFRSSFSIPARTSSRMSSRLSA